MIKILKQKMDELESLENPTFPLGTNIHIYELIKKGRGWSVLSYRWNNVGRLDPYNDDDIVERPKNYNTLTQIKKNYGVGNINFVIDGNLYAPSSLFQVIIECDENQKSEIIEILSKKKGEMYTCLSYEWLDEIPNNKMKDLKSY
jgi:6-phosphogluconolactonase (cycloisomerase 2 family)